MAKKKKQTKSEAIDIDTRVKDALATIAKNISSANIQTMQDIADKPIRTLSTGSWRLDRALVRPFPVGIHQIMGLYGTAKTTLALHLCLDAQRQGRPVFYIDQEFSINKDIVGQITDLDYNKLNVLNFLSGEDAADAIAQIAGDVKGAVIIEDSVPRLVPEVMMTNSASDLTMGKLGALVSLLMGKLVLRCVRNDVTMIFINQARSNIGYGEKWSWPGGKALEHDTNQQVVLSRKKADLRKNQYGIPTGQTINAHVRKNKHGVSYIDAPIELTFGKGIDSTMEAIKLGQELGFFQRGGGWFTIPTFDILEPKDEEENTTKIQGESNLYDLLESNNEYTEKLFQRISEDLS